MPDELESQLEMPVGFEFPVHCNLKGPGPSARRRPGSGRGQRIVLIHDHACDCELAESEARFLQV